MPGPIDEQYEHVAAEAVAAAAYPEGGWREHLARLERRVAKIECWIEGDPEPELEPPEREP